MAETIFFFLFSFLSFSAVITVLLLIPVPMSVRDETSENLNCPG